MAKSSATRIRDSRMNEPVDERFRGSSDIPLLPEGVEKAHQLANKLAKFGPFDEIYASDLGRTKRTAEIIARATHSKPPKLTKDLQPWHLGHFEGTPVTKEKVAELNRLAHEEPDKKIPGRGPNSTADGESFNSFVTRAAKLFYEQAERLKGDSGQRVFLETHYRNLLLFQALTDEGLPKDYKHEAGRLFEQSKGNSDLPPGTVLRFYWDGDTFKYEDFEFDEREGGLYTGRHEKTAWNKGAAKGSMS